MPLECGWFIVCERSSIDRERGITSIFECYDQVRTTVLPAYVSLLELNAYLFRDPEEAQSAHQLNVRFVVEPPGRPEAEVVGTLLTFVPGTWKLRIRAPVVPGFAFLSTGVYYFRLDALEGEWRKLARYPVEVAMVDQVEGGTSPG